MADEILAEHAEAGLPEGMTPGPETMRSFRRVLVNTLVSNVTTSFLWFALTFWAYLETRSVLATSISRRLVHAADRGARDRSSAPSSTTTANVR